LALPPLRVFMLDYREFPKKCSPLLWKSPTTKFVILNERRVMDRGLEFPDEGVAEIDLQASFDGDALRSSNLVILSKRSERRTCGLLEAAPQAHPNPENPIPHSLVPIP
jgi:hypothetical protein